MKNILCSAVTINTKGAIFIKCKARRINFFINDGLKVKEILQRRKQKSFGKFIMDLWLNITDGHFLQPS